MTRYKKESWIHPSLFTGPSRIDGVGVFTKTPIREGDTVIVWGGSVFTRKQLEAGEIKKHTMVAIGEDLFLGIPLSADYTVDDFMNHSCDPTVGLADEVTLVARRALSPEVELTADYATWLDNPDYVMKKRCNCQSSHCRKVITGHDWQRPCVQQQHRGFFSPFLKKRIERINLSGGEPMNVLITGGSRGIGNAIEEELVAAGHRVMLVARDGMSLESARKSLAQRAAVEPLAFACDVAKPDQRAQLRKQCEESGFWPSILVLNAGIFIEGQLVTADPGAYEDTLRVNVDACYHLVRDFVPQMARDSHSRVFLIGSTAAYEAYPLGPLYGISKWALRGFAVNLRKELMPSRIGVTTPAQNS
jgi:NADP-dependent 3-hydroxy acid dehydrogenase YdfG